MNSKRFSEAMSEISNKYVSEAISYNRIRLLKKRCERIAVIIAAVIAVSGLCGFAVYEFGLLDPWLQKPSTKPIETVRSAIEGQTDKEYTIALCIEEIRVDEAETVRVKAMYSGSELAKARGWTDEYLEEHFLVVFAKYYTEYDHTKTFLDDGYTEQFFYLTQAPKTGEWTIIDNTSPKTSAQ